VVLLLYFDLRRWARATRHEILAQRSSDLIVHCPFSSRQELVAAIDSLIDEIERVRDAGPCGPVVGACNSGPAGADSVRGVLSEMPFVPCHSPVGVCA
jgi:hypothetical protein